MISPRNWRRWLRFSLRTWLFTLVALTTVVGLTTQSAVRQRRAVQRLEVMDFEVYYDIESTSALSKPWLRDFFYSVVDVTEFESPPSDQSVRRAEIVGCLTCLPRLQLAIVCTPLVDKDMVALGKLQHLERLDIDARHISVRGLRELGRLRKLRDLTLWYTQLSGEPIKLIGQLTTLEELQFWDD